MTITVTTGGPSSGTGTQDPLTLGQMITAIADDIDDTTNEYTNAIRRAVLSAIRYCERENYYFNETRDATFVTVSGQEWYDANDSSDIPILVKIVAAYAEDASGQRIQLERALPVDIENLSDNSASRGKPYCFTYFGQRIRLYPVPGPEVYTIRLQLGPYRLWAPSEDGESNAWVNEAYDMVKARAKYILNKDTLKNAAMATEALNDYQDQNDALKAETSRRNSRGVIIGTCF